MELVIVTRGINCHSEGCLYETCHTVPHISALCPTDFVQVQWSLTNTIVIYGVNPGPTAASAHVLIKIYRSKNIEAPIPVCQPPPPQAPHTNNGTTSLLHTP